MPVDPHEWSPRWDRWPKDLVDEAARALFVTAWADREEEEHRSYSGQNLFDVAPPTPPEADQAAAELVRAFEVLNKSDVQKMYEKALLTGGNLEDSHKNRKEFGFLLAMQALGHGVGLGDTFGDHGLEVPYIEFYLPD